MIRNTIKLNAVWHTEWVLWMFPYGPYVTGNLWKNKTFGRHFHAAYFFELNGRSFDENIKKNNFCNIFEITNLEIFWEELILFCSWYYLSFLKKVWAILFYLRVTSISNNEINVSIFFIFVPMCFFKLLHLFRLLLFIRNFLLDVSNHNDLLVFRVIIISIK